jgi:uncharacterized membrane protein
MAALANILSGPLAIPVPPLAIHFSQLPIFIAGILGGPAVGLVTGAVGGLASSFVFLPQIPFILGGLAILGCAAGFASRKVRPLFAGILAWVLQAPYVVFTDYLWFTLFLHMAQVAIWSLLSTVMLFLTMEALISSALAEVITAYLKRSRISL